MKGYIHSLESFGTVDGPGVRYVVFFQGCPLRCLYCHNPDTWAIHGGTEMDAGDVLEKMTRNLPFYETGGITATGGEPLLQLDFLTELFTLAKEKGIHTALDTSGILFNRDKIEAFDRLMDVCDLVLLDIKHMDKNEHIRLTGASNESVFAFMDYLKEKKKPVWVRHVIVPNITYQDKQLKALGTYLKGFENVERIDVLPYHTMGAVKYQALGVEYPLKDVPSLTKEDAKYALEIINSTRLN